MTMPSRPLSLILLPIALSLTLGLATLALAQGDDEPEPIPPPVDPARDLPSRSTGEAVMGARDAFDRESPQFQVGRRSRMSADEAAARAAAQLSGDDATLSHDCESGERVELVGSRNFVTVTGLCVGLSISGDGNQVTVEVVDEIRIEGGDNDVRWQRALTAERPNVVELDGHNRIARLPASE